MFPRAMKASPLLRAWLGRLDRLGVRIRTRCRMVALEPDALLVETPDGTERLRPDAVLLALGGASWARLGSDGSWAAALSSAGDRAVAVPAEQLRVQRRLVGGLPQPVTPACR